MYLFDTFEGFDAKDVEIEKARDFSVQSAGHLKDASIKMVLDKMEYPSQCIIKKGYFPDTAIGLVEKFCFVNLDLDLYKPTLEGLKFFYPRMVAGGIILIHDYFGDAYKGVKKAVSEFNEIQEVPLKLFPIGDDLSIGIYC